MLLGAAVDIGHAFIVRRDLTAQADAAALAGSQALNLDALHQGQLALDPQQAQTAALQAITTSPRSCRRRAVASTGGVTVRLQEQIPTILLRLVGLSTLTVAAQATAAPRDTMKKTVSHSSDLSARLSSRSIGLLNGAHGTHARQAGGLSAPHSAAVAVIDLREHRIPNRIVLPAAAACALLAGPDRTPPQPPRARARRRPARARVRPAGRARHGRRQRSALDRVRPRRCRERRRCCSGSRSPQLAGLALTIRRGRAALAIALPLAPFLAAGAASRSRHMRTLVRRVSSPSFAAVLVGAIWLLSESRPPLPHSRFARWRRGPSLGFVAWLGCLLLAIGLLVPRRRTRSAADARLVADPQSAQRDARRRRGAGRRLSRPRLPADPATASVAAADTRSDRRSR